MFYCFILQDNREQNAECVFKAIRLHLAGKDFGQLLTTEQFAINNAINDPNIKELRKTIIDVASNQRYWGELKPAKWIRVEKLLQDERDKGVQVRHERRYIETYDVTTM